MQLDDHRIILWASTISRERNWSRQQWWNDKERWESSKRNYYIFFPRVIIKAIIIIMEKMGKWQYSGPRYLGGLTPCASGPQQGALIICGSWRRGTTSSADPRLIKITSCTRVWHIANLNVKEGTSWAFGHGHGEHFDIPIFFHWTRTISLRPWLHGHGAGKKRLG